MKASKALGRIWSVATDWRWWTFFLQRLFLSVRLRNEIAVKLASLRPVAGAEPAGRETELHRELGRSGLAKLGSVLTVGECHEIELYLQGCKAFDPYEPESARVLPLSAGRRKDAHVLHHSPEDVLRAPHLLRLANSPEILAVVAKYLGCRPTIAYLTAWWSFATARGAQHAELFHRDVDDWKFVKLFVYVTHVGPENGPHVYVTGSAATDELMQIRRFSDEEVMRVFGERQIVKLEGRPGDAFLEDTFGIHKGQPVIAAPRLIFQAVYSIFPMPYGPKRPVVRNTDLGAGHLDPWVNRIYVSYGASRAAAPEG